MADYPKDCGSNEDMMITVDKFVGIGTTATKTLHVIGDALIAGDSFINAGDDAIAYIGITANYIKAIKSDGIRIGTYNVGDVLSIKDTNGRVGIGTTNPSSTFQVGSGTNKFHVDGTNGYTSIGTTPSATTPLKVEFSSDTYPAIEIFSTAPTSCLLMGCRDASAEGGGNIQFSGSSKKWVFTEILTVLYDLGIGTTTPSSALHIDAKLGNPDKGYITLELIAGDVEPTCDSDRAIIFLWSDPNHATPRHLHLYGKSDAGTKVILA